MADEDISKPAEISLEPEQKELDLGQPKEPAAKPEPKPKVEGAEILARQLEEQRQRNELERNARMEAERVAHQRNRELAEVRQQAATAQTNLVDSQYQTVVNTIDAYRRESELARRDFAQSAAMQNWDALAEAQARMSRADAQVVQLETAKAQLEEQAQQYKLQQEQRTQQPQQRQYTPQERFDQYISQFSPRAQQYLRQHPEYATDERLNRRLIRMHGEAVDEQGLTADSEDYYRFLDQRMSESQPPEQRTRNVPARQQQPYSAPVSRGSVNGARSANSVTLSPAEREAARISGVSEVEYAKQMLELEAAGQIVRH